MYQKVFLYIKLGEVLIILLEFGILLIKYITRSTKGSTSIDARQVAQELYLKLQSCIVLKVVPLEDDSTPRSHLSGTLGGN